jgi:hypothetical protein
MRMSRPEFLAFAAIAKDAHQALNSNQISQAGVGVSVGLQETETEETQGKTAALARRGRGFGVSVERLMNATQDVSLRTA